MNVCSYHLQEAGATPVQELAFALATAIAVLDAVKARGQVPEADFPQVVGRISFFVNAGIRFVTEMCKMRAFAELWDEITRERYGVTDPKQRLFRYGVQVNSLGLTEQQPENNVYRILLEMLAVMLSKNARARAVQLPAWNEALGLPRPWDQQWSLRLQQIVAYETDLLEYDDIFDGSAVIAAQGRGAEARGARRAGAHRRHGRRGGRHRSGYMKQRLVESNPSASPPSKRGDQIVVGVNRYHRRRSPRRCRPATGVDHDRRRRRRERADRAAQGLARGARGDGGEQGAGRPRVRRAGRPQHHAALDRLRQGRRHDRRVGRALRNVFGEYRAPTGVARAAASSDGSLRKPRAARSRRVSQRLGRRIKILVGKPGLDGHSNGAEQIAVRARDCGIEVVYEGIRLTPERRS